MMNWKCLRTNRDHQERGLDERERMMLNSERRLCSWEPHPPEGRWMVKHDFLKVTIFLVGELGYHMVPLKWTPTWDGHGEELSWHWRDGRLQDRHLTRHLLFLSLNSRKPPRPRVRVGLCIYQPVSTDKVADANRTWLRLITPKEAGHQPTSTTIYNDKLVLTVVNNHSSIFQAVIDNE